MKRTNTNIIILITALFISCGNGIDDDRIPVEQIVEVKKKQNWNYNPIDGWQNKSILDSGIDTVVVDSLVNSLYEHQENTNDFTSFLIIKDHYLIYKKYFGNGNQEKLHSIKSVTKSITSLLIGKAIELGLIDNVNQKISEFFPKYFENINDSLKEHITIKHLLTMSAGFEWNNFGGKYRSGWDLYKGNRNQYMITQTLMESNPGEIFNYNSGLSHMLSGIISDKSGLSTEQFAEEYLFDSLGITNYKWTKDRNGYNLGNSELFLTSRDMAKIGLLVLNNGFWYDKQLIDSAYINKMLSPQIKTEGIGEKYSEHYGYQWWVKNYKNITINFCAGYGGQYIIVIPKLDLVFVFTTNWQTSNSSFKPLELIERLVDLMIK